MSIGNIDADVRGLDTWAQAEKGVHMTDNKAQKRAIRQRMEETGEKYTTAQRALLATEDRCPELPQLIKPGAVIAIVNGGGATNLAFAMPVLAHHLDSGGHLVVTQYGDDRFAIPSAPDLVVARGIASVAEMTAWLEARDEGKLRHAFEAAVSGVKVFKGPTTPEILADALKAEPNPLLYVQDVQTDPPLLRPAQADRRDEFELVPDNVRAIRQVIEQVRGAAIVGHCMPAYDIEGWEPISEVADHTLAIEHDYLRFDRDDDRRFDATIEVFDPAGPLDSYETTIDTSFLRWRHPLLPTSSPGA
ncbi:MAG TPA: hypothetical protein VFJ57_07680 [Solirubrobacterales bacterium]|nr:hypothetical protein [Solirubrobacterales bacterium]